MKKMKKMLALLAAVMSTVLMIGDSREMSEGFYAMAAEPKELYVVEGAMHIDHYDDVTKIPFDKIENFFNENLK